jgi:hypothetical protein
MANMLLLVASAAPPASVNVVPRIPPGPRFFAPSTEQTLNHMRPEVDRRPIPTNDNEAGIDLAIPRLSAIR